MKLKLQITIGIYIIFIVRLKWNIFFNFSIIHYIFNALMNSNKIILILIISFLFSTKSQAQKLTKFYYGPRIGLGVSTFAGHDAQHTNYPVGTIVGLYTHTEIKNKFSVDAELNYISLGSFFSTKYNTLDQHDYRISLGYISLPINLNYRCYKGLNLQLGIQTSAILTAVTEEKYHNKVVKGKSLNDFHAIDVGPTVGMYYQFSQGLQFGLRYYRGLQDIYKNDFKIYNTNLQFLVTFQFARAGKEL